MQYYKKIEIDYFDEIVSDTLKYLKEQKPNIYNKTIEASNFILDYQHNTILINLWQKAL